MMEDAPPPPITIRQTVPAVHTLTLDEARTLAGMWLMGSLAEVLQVPIERIQWALAHIPEERVPELDTPEGMNAIAADACAILGVEPRFIAPETIQ